jgi:hypothetical protein
MKNLFKILKEFVVRNKKEIISSFIFLIAMGTTTSFADFWSEGVDGISKFIKVIGIVLGAFGIVSLGEGFANDNPAAKNQGAKQLAAGGAIFFLAPKLLEQLKNIFA